MNKTSGSMTIEQCIKDNLINLLFSNLLLNVLINYIFIQLTFCITYPQFGSRALIIWFLYGVALSVLRLLLGLYHTHSKTENQRFMVSCFAVLTWASAAVWGVVSFVVPFSHEFIKVTMIMLIAGVAAGASQSLQSNRVICSGYLIFCLIPNIVHFIADNKVEDYVLGFVTLIYFIFLNIIAFRGFRLLRSSLELRYTNISLIADLQQTNMKLETAYETVTKKEQEEALINKLYNLLQNSDSLEEVKQPVIYVAKQLLPSLGGGFAIFDKGSNTMELVEQWGHQELLKQSFSVQDCLALKTSHTKIVKNPSEDMICLHFKKFPRGSYICLPIVAQNHILAALYFFASIGNTFLNNEKTLIIMFGNIVRASFATIHLRTLLHDQSIRDPLTGLYNRRYLHEWLPQELKRNVKSNHKISIGMIDLDHFKKINDTYGHEVGDELLKYTSSLLLNVFYSDLVFRLGGDEFLVVLEASSEEAFERFNLLREEMKKAEIIFQNRVVPTTTLSIGISTAPTHGTIVETLITASDRALYTAKAAGRDKVIIYSSEKNID